MSDLRVCFLGDSLTFGQGDEAALGWPGRVVVSAQTAGVNLTGYNLGVRGDTGAQIALRAAAEVKARFRSGDSRAVTIFFGANDISQDLPLSDSVAALASLLTWSADHGITAFVLSPPLYLDPMSDALAAGMTAAFAKLCAQHGAAYLDLRDAGVDWALWWAQAGAGDGVHPGREAYASLARVFSDWSAWRTWIER
jgi:lysophospholipase L1-like esterase